MANALRPIRQLPDCRPISLQPLLAWAPTEARCPEQCCRGEGCPVLPPEAYSKPSLTLQAVQGGHRSPSEKTGRGRE